MPNQTIRKSELSKLCSIWEGRADDLVSGKNWTNNDAICRKGRCDKAEGIQECIIELKYLMKHGYA